MKDLDDTLIKAKKMKGFDEGDKPRWENDPGKLGAAPDRLRELLRAPTEGYAEAIVVPPILAEQFELKHSLINMITSDQMNEAMKAMKTQINMVKNKLRNEIKNFIQTSLSNQTNEIKNIMASLLQMNTTSTSGSGSLFSNTVANPKGELKAITTRSGLVIDGPIVPTPPQSINSAVDERVEETFTDPNLTEYNIKVPPPPVQKYKPLSQREYVLHQRDPLHLNIPYPSRMLKQKQQEKDEYQKMLKALLSNKKTLQELENIPLNENCSVVILKNLPKKLRDPGKFLIPCGFSELKCKALADLGASINLMPLFVWKKLDLPELISTCMTLELANRAICTLARIARDVFVPVGNFTFLADFVIVDYESDPRFPLILGRPFLRTAHALIDVNESINLINVFNNSSEDFLKDLFSNQLSGNPTFSSHPELTSPKVNDDIFDSEGSNVLSKNLLDLDSTKDPHPPLHVSPLSGSTTFSSNSLLEEFVDELAFPPKYNDDLQFDIESDLKEIEFLLYQDADSSLKDSIDQSNLANPADNVVDSVPEMFTDEHALDYSSPLIFDEYDDDFLEIESDAENVYDDPYDSKGEKIKESKILIYELDLPCDFNLSKYDSFISQDLSRVDSKPSTDNEGKIFNPGILIQEKSFKIITCVVQDKKLDTSNASFVLKDFDPPFYEPFFFKEVPSSKMLLLFSSKNEEKVFKPGIHTSEKVYSSFIPELSHPGYKIFKINQIFKSPMKIFLFSCEKDTHTLVVPCLYFTLLDQLKNLQSQGTDIEIVVYADSYHAGDYVDRKSTNGIFIFVGCCLTSWFSKKQIDFVVSPIEAEYVSAGKASQQAVWMKQGLIDYDIELDDVLIMCDNKGAIDRRNCRRSKQPFILEESPVDTKADQRTMAELLRTPTEGYAEAIMVPPILAEQFELKHGLINMMTSNQFFGLEKDNHHDHIRWGSPSVARKRTPAFEESFHEACDRYKDLLRACPHHGFTEFHQLDTFYNALNPTDQDSLISAAGGNLLERRTQDVLTIIENKSKQTSVVTTAMTAILKQIQATPPPASVKSVKEIYVTCGGAHPYYQCLAGDGNTFPEHRDNIQGYVAAAAVNYNQGNSGYRPPGVANQIRPPGSGYLPSNIIANPKGELKAITTRSGIVLDGPSVPIPPPFINLEEDECVDETLTDQDLAEYTIKVPPPLVQKPKTPSQRNFVVHQRDPLHPNAPYPLRMHKQKQQEKDKVQIHKFWQMFKQLHINITLADALILILKYQEMLKALLSNKEKLLELANKPLNENCAAVILKKLPEKLRDPRKFLILCGFNELKCKALADLGASINFIPLSFWKKLGIARDVFFSVDKFTFPANFVIIDFESDPIVPLILGRPFLRTARALIDIYEEEMILRDGDERLTLNMRNDTSSYSNQPQKESIIMINICDDSKGGNVIKYLNENPTPDHVLKSLSPFPIPVEDIDSFLEKSNTSLSYLDNFLPEYKTYINHMKETNSDKSRVHVPNVWTTHPTLMLDSDFILSDNSLPEYEIFYFDNEEKNSNSTTIYADISLLDLLCFNFDFKPDLGKLTSIVDFGIRKNVLFVTNVNLPPKEDHSPL
nr:reverse transcriptase domain-containing protein [Tanacetum cinerariifolium]